MKDLNLVPKSYLKKRKKQKKIVVYFFFIVVIAMVMTVVVSMPFLRLKNLKNELTIYEKNMVELMGYIKIEEEFNVVKGMYTQRENEASKLLNSDVDVVEVIKRLEACLPEKMFVQHMGITRGQGGMLEMTIRASAGSEDEIATFYDYVSNDELFSGINISVVNSLQTTQLQTTDTQHKGSVYTFEALIYLTQ